MEYSTVDKVLNSICSRGCRYVYSVLADFNSKQSCEELLVLDQRDQAVVIAELQSVMSVYDQSGCCDS